MGFEVRSRRVGSGPVTVPLLVLPERAIDDSFEIMCFADEVGEETRYARRIQMWLCSSMGLSLLMMLRAVALPGAFW